MKENKTTCFLKTTEVLLDAEYQLSVSVNCPLKSSQKEKPEQKRPMLLSFKTTKIFRQEFDIYQGTGATNCFQSHTNS